MTSTKARYLLDVNLLIARTFKDHEHYSAASEWFKTPGLQWALCPFTEAGFLRYATAPGRGNLSMGDATAILDRLAQHPGYQFQPHIEEWRSFTKPFFNRLHGHNQVTDAYLLGVAIRNNLVLATFDRGILHLAGEDRRSVWIVGG